MIDPSTGRSFRWWCAALLLYGTKWSRSEGLLVDLIMPSFKAGDEPLPGYLRRKKHTRNRRTETFAGDTEDGVVYELSVIDDRVGSLVPTPAPQQRPRPTRRPSTPALQPSPMPQGIVPTTTDEPTAVNVDPTASPSAKPISEPTAKPSIIPLPPPPTETPIAVVPTISPSVVVVPTVRPTPSPTNLCNASPSLRELLIRVVLNGVSSTDEIDTPGSPQNLAFNWIVNLDPEYLCPDSPTLVQRYSLAVFYYSTAGENWIECSAPAVFDSQDAINAANDACQIEPVDGSGSNAWLTPGTECQWGGVVCDPVNGTGPVQALDLESNGLAGTLPSELSQLVALRFLSFEDGVIGGSIPTAIGSLSDLEVLDMNFNLLEGPLPSQLYSLTRMTQIDLNDNLLTGDIGTAIGSLTDLTFLQLQNNQLIGTIPSELQRLLALGVANFEENSFSGSMPSGVCNLLGDGGQLSSLTADCLQVSGRQSPPYVECSCCTQCF